MLLFVLSVRGLNFAAGVVGWSNERVRDGAAVPPKLALAEAHRAERLVPFGQTASAAYAARRTGRGSATSRFEGGSLAVHFAGARSGTRVTAAHVGSAARQSECRGRFGTGADARLLP